MRGRASFNPSISKNLFSSVYIHRIRDHSNLSPFEKKRTLVTIPRHPHYFIRSIKRRRNFQFPNTNKDPTFLRWIPSIFSFKNSHDIVKKIKRIIINYIIRGKIEKPFNLIDDSKDVFERARLMLIRDELESWRDSISNICCLEDQSKLISLFVNDYFVISLPFPCRFILARLEYVFFA